MNWNELNELELETHRAILETEKATSETQRAISQTQSHIEDTERHTEHFGTGSPNRTQKAELGTQGALLGT